MIGVWGLKNCDTCRKARKWLDANGIVYEFYDVRADGIDKERLEFWVKELGWESLLNRRGTTWRTLSEAEKSDVDEVKASALMLKLPALMKRPVFETRRSVLLGFTTAVQAALAQPK